MGKSVRPFGSAASSSSASSSPSSVLTKPVVRVSRSTTCSSPEASWSALPRCCTAEGTTLRSTCRSSKANCTASTEETGARDVALNSCRTAASTTSLSASSSAEACSRSAVPSCRTAASTTSARSARSSAEDRDSNPCAIAATSRAPISSCKASTTRERCSYSIGVTAVTVVTAGMRSAGLPLPQWPLFAHFGTRGTSMSSASRMGG
eukprot:scaffold119022_cov57-Phaeocystis_antarctica.AAC.1